MIEVVGTNYKLTRLAERDRLAASKLPPRELAARVRAELGTQECIVLRTCNRIEIYVADVSGALSGEAVRTLLCEPIEGADALPAAHTYHCNGGDAVAHLFSVASGIDSMILGEHEIMAQVRSALAAARVARTAGRLLCRLFQHALRTGKRARRETAISAGVFSIGQCVARLAQQTVGSLTGKHLLLIGAGQVAKSVGKHMVALGAGPVTVLGRTAGRARPLAELLGGEAAGFERIEVAVAAADIVAACADAPHYVLRLGQVEEAWRQRDERPLLVLDLGAPRNVEPAIASLPCVSLLDLDAVEKYMGGQMAARAAEVARVRFIITEETQEFLRWLTQALSRPARGSLLGKPASAERAAPT